MVVVGAGALDASVNNPAPIPTASSSVIVKIVATPCLGDTVFLLPLHSFEFVQLVVDFGLA